MLRLLGSTAAVLSLVLAVGALSRSDVRPELAAASAQEATDFDYELFAAVLEGLYVDGVSNEAVDAITAKDPEHGYPANFVWGCPVCMPAYRAFLTYRARPHFDWLKGSQDFGRGLDAATQAALTTGELLARQQALMQLVGRWVERRMSRLRLTPDESAQWKQEMELRRKTGMSTLANYKSNGLRGSYAQMEACPLCDGANKPFSASGRRR